MSELKPTVGDFVMYQGRIYTIKAIDRGSVFLANYEVVFLENFDTECSLIRRG